MEKICETCLFRDVVCYEYPCKQCGIGNKLWKPAEEAVPAEASEAPAHDPVNHPSHYCQEGGMECIDEMVAVFGERAVMDFCLLNVWKYRKRAVFKNGEEDLKKSDWYMKKYLELKGDL